MYHRGPDDWGIFIDKNLLFGFRRLSIIDLSQSGHQPISNEDGSLWLICNGEIYNYLGLKEDLRAKVIILNRSQIKRQFFMLMKSTIKSVSINSVVKKTIDLFYPYIDEFSTVFVSITTPYPGSPLYYYGLKTGFIKNNDQLFNKLRYLRNLVVNFSKLSNWKIRYLRLKLTFNFDLKKLKITKGKWRAYFLLIKVLSEKIIQTISNNINIFLMKSY